MHDPSAARGPIEALVRVCSLRLVGQARRRECFFALATALAGGCCLLLLGTRYVPFAALPLVAGLGAWAAVRRWNLSLPSGYEVAQRIDGRQGLPDQVATAYHFRTAGVGGASRSVVEAQYEIASTRSEAAEPARLFPDVPSESRKASAILVAAAVLLFGLRAAVQEELSLEPPLPSALLAYLLGPEGSGRDESLRAAGIEESPEEVAAVVDAGPQTGAESDPDPAGRELPGEWYDEEEGSDEAPEVEGLITVPLDEFTEPVIEEAGGPSEAPGDDGGDDGSGAPPDPADDSWDEEAQSLLDKLKQAFENMLQTLEMASTDGPEQQPGQDESSGSAEESDASGEPAESGSPDDQMASEAADASMEGGEAGQEAGETASAGNTSGEDSSGDQSSGENASAAGTSDGDKEFAEAEQLEVLGALEQLYMERAENMKGDVTVETRRAEQTASVPYRERETVHADRGGAVSRDEIPPAYRAYIQNYFETLRRSAE